MLGAEIKEKENCKEQFHSFGAGRFCRKIQTTQEELHEREEKVQRKRKRNLDKNVYYVYAVSTLPFNCIQRERQRRTREKMKSRGRGRLQDLKGCKEEYWSEAGCTASYSSSLSPRMRCTAKENARGRILFHPHQPKNWRRDTRERKDGENLYSQTLFRQSRGSIFHEGKNKLVEMLRETSFA